MDRFSTTDVAIIVVIQQQAKQTELSRPLIQHKWNDDDFWNDDSLWLDEVI